MVRWNKKTKAPLDHSDWIEWARLQVKDAEACIAAHARAIELIHDNIDASLEQSAAACREALDVLSSVSDMEHLSGMLQRVVNSFDSQRARRRAEALISNIRSEPSSAGDIVEVMQLTPDEYRALPSQMTRCIVVKRWVWDLFVELSPRGLLKDTLSLQRRLNRVFNDADVQHEVSELIDVHMRRMRKVDGTVTRFRAEEDETCRREVAALRARYADIRKRYSITNIAKKWGDHHIDEPQFERVSTTQCVHTMFGGIKLDGFFHVVASHKNALLLMQDAAYYIVHRDVVRYRGE